LGTLSNWTLQLLCESGVSTNSAGFSCGQTNPVSGNSFEIDFTNNSGAAKVVTAIARVVTASGKVVEGVTKVSIPSGAAY
jgi:hypothetical protein